ncbi:MAG: thiopeptide-type bacteriocin biosynthesis protein [Saprospiraceae bacterium]|nr:thiopeptide-type bacteriocin biosynthesis protein [Saprospiraceae bacterium]
MNWLSIHFYPLENQDVFLVRGLKPFLQQHIWSQRGALAFFIRYQDERGPHIRLRMHGEDPWMEETLRPAFEGWQEGRGEWAEVPYTPEIERFGGDEAIALAEEYFHLSSRVALERLVRDQHTYGDSMFDALRMHTIAAHAAGMNQEQAARYFGQLTEQWLPLFYPTEGTPEADFYTVIKEGFEKNFIPQKEDLQATLIALWKALEKEKFDKKQPEWARWALGNQMILKALDKNLDRALPSLLHLTNNRLGLNNQDEVYLNFILAKTLA